MVRTRFPLLVLCSSLILAACGGGDSSEETPGGGGGKGGQSGGGQGGSASGGAGAGGAQAGKGGASSGASGQGGAQAGAGQSGSSGQSGASGAGSGGAGQSGAAGQSGGGQSGSSGQSGQSGSSGQSGQSGQSGAGQAGAGAGGQSGSSGQSGASGTAGDGGAGGGEAGSAGAGGGEAGSAGVAGEAGAAGAAGEAGSAGSSGCVATDEVCDGLDNDCDGQIDEETSPLTACDTGALGACAKGQTECVQGQLVCVTTATPQPEVCDGQDSDCDGDPDNALTDTGGPCNTGAPGACAKGTLSCLDAKLECVPNVQPTAELCNGIDDNCDGSVDETFAGTGEDCLVPGAKGECAKGKTVCKNNGVQCLSSVLPGVEVCDGLDNDCDGKVDEDLPGLPCDTGQLGACAQGVQVCSNGKPLCSPLALSTPEDCNGVDDDCNGAVDDGLPDLVCGVGECQFTAPACVNGKTQFCIPNDPKAEVCDGLDNNCDGQADEGNTCCPVNLKCADSCCGVGEVCSFQKCVQPGKTCFASEDCASGEYCDYSLGTVNNPPPGCQGANQKTGKCLPKPPSCAQDQDPGEPPVCVQKCEYKPPAPAFDPELKYSWGGKLTSPTNTDVMMTPIILQLDDDDCDGKVTERDIPDIVFTTFSGGAYTSAGTLHAISIINGVVKDKWSTPASVHAGKQLAGGDLDGKPGSEIVGCGTDGRVRAYGGDGKLLWTGALVGCGQPAIADLDGDGKPEVITEKGVLNGATGQAKATFAPAMIGTFAVTDLDGDGKLDIVSASQAYRADGTQFVNVPAPAHTYSGCTSGYYFCASPAVADLDKDGKPEVVGVYFNQHQLSVWQYDASKPNKYTVLRTGIDINKTLNPALCGSSAGSKWGGGAATVGDFNADTYPDVALAGGVGYAVFDGKKLADTAIADANTFLWVKQTQDCSSAGTGSSLFDFNGDGKAEVLYADEVKLHIYEGATGNVLYETCNTSGTLSEYPLVADVDNDGQADIIVASNAYSSLNCGGGAKTAGIRVFGSKSKSWVRTRRIWNQFPYYISNINEDGTVPSAEAINWKQPGLNNYRINKQPGGEFSAPDLVISVAPTCSGPYALVATLRNLGEAPVGPGVKVGFYTASGTKLGEATTASSLYPADAETLTLSLAQPPSEDVYVVADDASAPHSWVECRTANNKSATTKSTCAQLNPGAGAGEGWGGA